MGSDSHTHTPGPWGIEKTATELWIGPKRSDGNKVDSIVTHVDWGRQYKDEYNERQEANARLIAAAPCMKEALEKLQAFFDSVTGHCFGGGGASEYGADLDYGEFLDLAEKAGLLRTEEYDPDKHGSGADCAPGDTWYVPTHIGRAALSRATKGGEDL